MRTIESPGVEIKEIDLSFNTQLPVGTTVFAVGYAPQGPTDELVNVTSVSEFEQIYGLPTNASERYFYNTCIQVLNANGTLMTTRLPYGSGSGIGFTNNYSALVFPVFPFSMSTNNYTFVGGATAAKTDTLVTYTSLATGLGDDARTYNYYNAASGQANFVGGIQLNTIAFTLSTSNFGIINFINNAGTLSASNDSWGGTITLASSSIDNVSYTWDITTSNVTPITSGTLKTNYIYTSATSVNYPQFSKSENYYIGQPFHISVDESTYFQWTQGGINWKDIIPTAGLTTDQIYALSGVGYAGMVLVNKAKTTIDDKFAGYYVAIADNSKVDKGSNFDSIAKIYTINNSTASDEWLEVNQTRLAFALSGTYSQHQGSVSEIVETIPSYDFSAAGANGYTDSLIIASFKIRPTIYNTDSRILDNILVEAYVGSLDSTRTIQNPRGGSALNFYLEDIVNSASTNMQLFINPNISQRSGAWFDATNGLPTKSVRVMAASRINTDSSVATDPAEPYGLAAQYFTKSNASSYMSVGDNLNGVGEFISCLAEGQKLIGNMPMKLERALMLAENRELIRVDIVPEGGLGTVWTGMYLDMNNWPVGTTDPTVAEQTNQEFDDTRYVNGILNSHTFDADSEGLLDQATGSASIASDLYETIYNIFNNFSETTRRDCLYIADPLRYIFVQGTGNVKVMDDKTKNFSQHIFWPLKNLFGAANSSYATTYANWFKSNDKSTAKLVWMPPSGWLANIMVKVDTNQYPWYAPAGLNRGILRDVVDIGINPSQKQRDLLYKNGINPTVYWPGDGYVVWGQKTLQQRPSAFDRINVRRLFLWLEKATLALTRYFVFEQNTVFTRERLKTAIAPIFEFAKNNEGVYDYMIVCDERNNPPDVIDRNELIVDIYIKPVRVAEFILVNFIATRTGQDFSELI